MASQPTAAPPQPPPELPSMSDVSTTMSNYLRTFSLWCRNSFAGKLDAKSALPGVMLMAYDSSGAPTGAVYRVTIKMTGTTPALVMTPVALGGGSP